MTFRFTQELTIRKTGFGNTCMAELGVPTPVAGDFWEGSKLVEFDQHPYVAKSGWGNPDPSEYEDVTVETCKGVLIFHQGGLTIPRMTMDYSTPQFWGLKGQDDAEGLELDDHVWVNSELTQITFQAAYDSTVYVAYDLSRVAFQSVKVEKDGKVREFKNVACLPKDPWHQASATFRMWGQTDSWGSEGQKFLTIPAREIRHV